MSDRIDYNTRPYKDGDEKKIITVLEKIFRRWPSFDLQVSQIDHWKWKYLNKIPDKIDVVVTEYQDKIIGTNHGLFMQAKIGKNLYLGHKGSDLGVDPDYRKIGVFSSLSKAKREIDDTSGIAISYWITSNPVLIESYSKLPDAFFFPNPLRYYVKIKNIDLHLEKAERGLNYKKRPFEKIGYITLNLWSKIKNTIKLNKRLGKKDYNISQISEFDEKIEVFWDSVRDEYDFIVEKSQNYLNWRYCDPRGGNYSILLAADKDRILGFIVLRINRIIPDYPVGFIVEVIGLPDRLDVVYELVSFGINYFNEKDVNVVHAQIMSGNSYEGLLRRNGFIDTRIKPYLYFRPFEIAAEDLNIFKNTTGKRIHYQYGEADDI